MALAQGFACQAQDARALMSEPTLLPTVLVCTGSGGVTDQREEGLAALAEQVG